MVLLAALAGVELLAKLVRWWWPRLPGLVIVMSGKRKSGKDFFAEELVRRLNASCANTAAILHLSEPLKAQYALDHNLDLTGSI